MTRSRAGDSSVREVHSHFGEHASLERARARLARAIGRTVRVRGVDRALRTLYTPDARADGYTKAITRLRDGSAFEIDTRSFLEWTLYLYGQYEPHVRDVIEHCLSPGDDAVDVGANIGVHTVAMACAVESGGHVLAVEPYPPLVERLRRNVELNDLANVVLVEKAASDHVGVAVFYPPEETATNQAQGSLFALENLGEPHEVELVTVDDLCRQHGLDRVRLIKIDVEGSEAEVIEGARKLIREQRPYVLFEYNAGHYATIGRHWSEVSWLGDETAPYALFAVQRHGLERLSAVPSVFGCMVLARPEGAEWPP